MKTKFIVSIIIVAIMALVIGLLISPHNMPGQFSAQSGHIETWYCPMHPHYTSDRPGQCPICGMNLVKREVAAQEAPASAIQQGSSVDGYTTISETVQKLQLIGLATAIVKLKPLIKSIRAFGIVTSDAELYQNQNEFIDAYVSYVKVFRDYKQIRDRRHIWESHRDVQTRLLEAKDKLLKLGLNEAEILQLQQVSWNEVWRQPKLLFFNETKRYWVKAQVFEQDYAFVHEGQDVEVNVEALQEKVNGVVRSVGGFIDPTSRSVSVLIELADDAPHLAANLQVDVTIPLKLNAALWVPRQAVMDTGLRKIVFVSIADSTFEPREIQTGMETDDGFEVKSGLSEGERIVVSGNFLLDSESRVQAGLQADTAPATVGGDHGK